MKAWQFTKTHEPLVLADVEKSTAGPGQVVLEMKAAGICHSDVGQMTDEACRRACATLSELGLRNTLAEWENNPETRAAVRPATLQRVDQGSIPSQDRSGRRVTDPPRAS